MEKRRRGSKGKEKQRRPTHIHRCGIGGTLVIHENAPIHTAYTHTHTHNICLPQPLNTTLSYLTCDRPVE